jgi:predicted phage-related endonuclease
MQIDMNTVALDPDVARYVLEFKKLKLEEAQLKEQLADARQRIESAMGEATLALVDGAPAVRWSPVESERFDVKKAREVLPQQVLDLLLVKSFSRRFTLIDGSEIY